MKVGSARELLDLALQAAWAKDDSELGWLLAQFAGVSSVEFTKDVETASIRRTGDSYTVRFAKSFVERYLRTPDDVLFVLLHEIMHKVRGDLVRDFGLNGPIDGKVANLVEDMLINAELCARYFETPPQFFEKLYDKNSFPGVLLTPPPLIMDRVRDEARQGRGEESLFEKVRQGLKELRNAEDMETDDLEELEDLFTTLVWDHFNELSGLPRQEDMLDEDLDSETGVKERVRGVYSAGWLAFKVESAESLFEKLRSFFSDEPEMVLLGDHYDKNCPLPGWEDIFGDEAAYSENESEDEIAVGPSKRHAGKVARLLRRALEADPANPVERMLMQPERSVVPWVGRREGLWIAQGLWPVFFNAPTYSRDLEHLRPHIYIDVSGSTNKVQPLIYGLMAHLADIIGGPLYLFSNTVAEASMEDIKKGRRTTTRGTDFDCVIEHAVKNRFRKIVIITDGCADMNGANRSKITSGQIQIYIVLTDRKRYASEEVLPLAKEVFRLE